MLVTVDELSGKYAQEHFQRSFFSNNDIGEVLLKLHAAGAKTIAYDTSLEVFTSEEKETRLLEALKTVETIVLNCYYVLVNVGGIVNFIIHEPAKQYQPFSVSGLANITLDEDLVLRRIMVTETVDDHRYFIFAHQIASQYLGKSPEEVLRDIPTRYFSQPERYELPINFAGPEGTFPSMSVQQILENSDSVNEMFVKDKICIIGWNLVTAKNRFETPLSTIDNQYVYGAEVHANILHTIIHGGITHSPLYVEIVLTVICLALSAWLSWAFSPAKAILSGSITGALIVAVSCFLFMHYTLWLNICAPLSASALVLAVTALLKRRKSRAATADSAMLDRCTMALSVIDMCGSTDISNKFGDTFATRLKNTLRDIVSDSVKSSSLEFSKGTGDGMLMGFSNAKAALAACHRILQTVAKRNITVTDSEKIHLRAAVHLGEINKIKVGDQVDIEGEAANFVCRLEGIKADSLIEDPGGLSKKDFPAQDRIIISEAVFDEVSRLDDFSPIYAGYIELKGIRGRHRIYLVKLDTNEH